MLNGREARWRQEVLAEYGFRKHILTGRYFPPGPDHPMLQEPGVHGHIPINEALTDEQVADITRITNNLTEEVTP